MEENRYGLTVSKIRRLVVADRTPLSRLPDFERGEKKWSLWKSVGSREDYLLAAEDSIEIRIYDEDAPEHAGEFWFEFRCYEGLSGFEFEEFDGKGHEPAKEEFLRIVNALLDSGVLRQNG